MGFLFARSKTTQPDFTGLQVNTAVNSLPVPINFGSPRGNVNLIYTNGFRAVQSKASGSKGLLSGGKGGGSGQTDYYATIILAIGEGPCDAPILAYLNQSVYTPATLPQPLTFVSGTPGQDPWLYIVDHWPADALSYSEICYLGGADYKLDSSGTVPQFNFIVRGFHYGTCPLFPFVDPQANSWFLDADPSYCLEDILDSPQYGVGFPAGLVDHDSWYSSADGLDPDVGDASFQSYAQAVGFGLSAHLDSVEPCSSVIDRWTRLMVTAVVWNGQTLRLIPYWDRFCGANPGWDAGAGVPKRYYNPGTLLTVRWDFTDDDYLQTTGEEDPITVRRKDAADVYSRVNLDYRDRLLQFNNNLATAVDDSEVEVNGVRVDSVGQCDIFTLSNFAQTSAQLQLQRNIAIRRTFTFRTHWGFCWLDPMDVVTVTDANLGLSKFPCRVVSIEEDEKFTLTFELEETQIESAASDPPASDLSSIPAVGSVGSSPDVSTNIPAPAVNSPIIMEPPAPLLATVGVSTNTLAIALSGGPGGTYDPNWGGAIVLASDDDVTYREVGEIFGPSTMGVTTATFSGGTLSVDLGESNGELSSATSEQAAMKLSLIALVGSDGSLELVAYTTATLTGPNTYNLTGIGRGLYGTAQFDHPAGTGVFYWPDAKAMVTLDTVFVGRTTYFKFQSFNIFRQGIEDLADCVAYTYGPVDTGFNPATNPISSTLMASSSVDLGNVVDQKTSALDLNVGGGLGGNPPILFMIDLGTLS